MPSQGRSRTGRPGWLLDDKIPSLLLVNSPFEQNDIILSINGIPANDLENLQLHLLNRNTRDVFEVEIQRDKRLKMIRMKL
jgi:S1-C subfamily serine protease